MKFVVFYIIAAVFLSFFSYTYNFVVKEVNRTVLNYAVAVSSPVNNVLIGIKDGVSRYLMLVGVEEENRLLKKEVATLKIKSGYLCNEKSVKNKKLAGYKLIKSKFGFKSNLQISYIVLKPNKKLNLDRNNCFILSDNLNLIGSIEKKQRDFYLAKTVFNSDFVVDVYIKSDNATYRALLIGDMYKPKAEFLDPNVSIDAGSPVYTSGEFGIYPKNIFIGRVNKVKMVNSYYKVAYIDVDKGFFNSYDMFVICKKKQ